MTSESELQQQTLELETQLKLCFENDGVNFNDLWHKVKLLTCQVILQNFSKSSFLTLRSIYELSCLLHLAKHDIENFSTTFNFLEPLYLKYKEPSEYKLSLYSVQLVYLLSLNRAGDFHSILGRLNSVERQHSAVCTATELEMTLMTGNYPRAIKLLQNPSIKLLEEPSKKVIENLRQQVATTLAQSHESISVSHAKQLLMLNSDQEFKSFVEQTNFRSHIISPSTYDNDMTESKTWSIKEGFVYFTSAEKKPAAIPAAEIINFVLSYASELERIV